MPADLPQLDLCEQLARIDHSMAETQTFHAENRKLTEQALKLTEEALKFREEALKFRRDRWLAPWLLVVSILSTIGAAGGLATLINLFHGMPK